MELNGSLYKVRTALTKLPNGSVAVDPLALVQIDYLTFWFFGTVTYGEVDFFYQEYFYNTTQYTGSNNVYNEAYGYKNAWDAIDFADAATSIFELGFALWVGAVAGPAVLFTAGWDFAQLLLATDTVNQAYSSDSSIGYIGTAIQNDYIYDGYLGYGTNGWGLRVDVGGTWQNALLPLAYSGTDSQWISIIAHLFQNTYGSQWTWEGVF